MLTDRANDQAALTLLFEPRAQRFLQPLGRRVIRSLRDLIFRLSTVPADQFFLFL